MPLNLRSAGLTELESELELLPSCRQKQHDEAWLRIQKRAAALLSAKMAFGTCSSLKTQPVHAFQSLGQQRTPKACENHQPQKNKWERPGQGLLEASSCLKARALQWHFESTLRTIIGRRGLAQGGSNSSTGQMARPHWPSRRVSRVS